MRMRLSYLLFEQSTELRSGAYRHCIFVGFLTLLRFVCRLPTNVFFHFLFFPPVVWRFERHNVLSY